MKTTLRDFFKMIGAAVATWTVSCKFEGKGETDPKGEKGEVGETGYNWNYRVYCYERGQGEWVFSENESGSFSHQREYFDLDDEREFSDVYYGWMDQGKLHFRSFEEARAFIENHAKTKDSTNIVDSIYDIYRINPDNLDYESAQPTELKVAQYWFNGDTGRTIVWESNDEKTNWTTMDCA